MNRWSEKKQKNRIKTQFGKNPIDMETWESLQLRMHEIEMYEQRRRKDSNQEWVDDVTWNDLEMDRVFARINHTRTYMGEQILYHRLHGRKNRQELQRMEKRIAFFFVPGIIPHQSGRKAFTYRETKRKLLFAIVSDG